MFRILVASAATALVMMTAGPVAAAPATDLSSSSGVSIADALEFRETFGLSTDPDVVAKSLSDPTAVTTWGTPVSEAEAATLAQREQLEVAAQPLADFVEGKSDSFGGLYFDQNAGQLKATIVTTPSTSQGDLASAQALIPDGLDVAVEAANHSMGELQSAADALSGMSSRLGIEMVGVDTRANGLIVTISPGHDQTAVAATVDVPVMVTTGQGLRPASCWNTCTPWRGGMNIWDQSFPIEGNCTWGFYGTRGSAAKYVISAGHCGKIGHVLRIKDPSNATIIFTDGIDQNTYDLSGGISHSDAQTAHVKANSNATTPFNTIIASSSDLNHSITSVHSNSQVVGGTVCFFGFASHRSSPCGTITIVGIVDDTTRADDGKPLHITNLVEMSLPAVGGDSGGPVYNGASAYGINYAVDAARSNHLVYSMAANVQLNTSTNICVSSAC